LSEPKDTYWSGRRVLVTGAGGFIGSHVAERLARLGANVRAFVRYTSRPDNGWLEDCDPSLVTELEIFRADLENPEAVANAVSGCETIFHLGALIPIPYSFRHAREFVQANVVGTLNVLEACRRSEIRRMVHTSTSEVYGTAVEVPIDEQHRLQAQSPYAATKIGADQLALSYRRSLDIPVVVARPFNTFGPRQSARAVIPAIVTQALTQDRIALGSLHPTRDFLFVADTVEGILACARAEGIEGEIVNLGTGFEISIGDLAALILGLVGQEAEIESVDERTRPALSEVDRLVASTDKAKALLGWSAQVELSDGLRRTIDWIRSVPSAYKPSLYQV
jgi:NAD dependent epimerase/dehydratase